MSKQLYEEAIADVKKLKEIAEDNAKRAVVEAVAPRIRELIEKELLSEAEVPGSPGAPMMPGEMLTDDFPADETAGEMPSPEDEVIVPLDQLAAEEEPYLPQGEEVGMGMEDVLESIVSSRNRRMLREFEKNLLYVDKMIDSLSSVDNSIRETKSYESSVSEVEGKIRDLYESVQERIVDPAQKLSCNLKIKNCLKKLEKLQEIKMKKRNGRLDEETISLELTGLPDDIDLESLGVNLVSGGGEEEEEGGEEEGGEELDLGGEEEEGEEGEEDEEDEEDEEEGGEEELDLEVEENDVKMPMESRRLRDDVIVEIDEGMLRREIMRMKKLREEAVPSTKGKKPGAPEFDDFGDADSEGEPLELVLRELDAASEGEEALPEYDESQDPTVEEGDNVEAHADEADDESATTPAAQDQGQSRQPGKSGQAESIRRRMTAELKLQETLRTRARTAARMYEAAKTRFSRAKTLSERKEISNRGSQHKAAYTALAKRYNESVKRFNRLSTMLAEANRPRNVRSNSGVNSAASSESKQLRNKLAETNLLNAKLMFTNKLLQSEALTARQKSQVIEQLDEAKTLREVKLVYESLAKTLATPRKTVTENRVIGSSSQATRSASSQTLNEGFEAERWAKLAGINK